MLSINPDAPKIENSVVSSSIDLQSGHRKSSNIPETELEWSNGATSFLRHLDLFCVGAKWNVYIYLAREHAHAIATR